MSKPQLSEQAVSALQRALRAEHAAIWIHGLAGAFASEQRVDSAVAEAVRKHRQFRETTEQLLQEAGIKPAPAEPAYSVPQQPTDQTSAIRLLITAEHDCTIGWRSVLETTEVSRLRRHALDALTTASARATRWRITIGDQPAVLAFPGRP
ncbi:ferritin-like domain-containing protein [Haloactinomyces albus]|uniref:DUF4439 domain-containing protein n=1 Tax=Haloactinomyces albus TaxID=1352928 RepID=A0AAE3ZBT9_9ACTN|nr:ferritin-like domain-containing protein [Haloactinomyces albus]MDR7300649.1 hypothetical protein [Haloactinomyces albus]